MSDEDWTGRVFASTPEATRAFAGRLAVEIRAALAPGRGASEASAPPVPGPELTGVLIGLDGELGAGKTTFAQGFVAALAEPGQAPYVTSPTFAILHRYATEPPVAHLDLYRLGSLEELEMIGYRDIYYGPGVILVEWMARVPEAIPREWLEIHLARERSDVREIRVRVHGPRLDRIVRKVL